MTDNIVVLHSNKFIDAEGNLKTIRKKFHGVVVTSENYQELLKEGGRDIINYHNKHLKAYLQGKDWFAFGKNSDGTTKHNPVLKQYYAEA